MQAQAHESLIQLGETHLQHQNLISDLEEMKSVAVRAGGVIKLTTLIKEVKQLVRDTKEIKRALQESESPVIIKISAKINGENVNERKPKRPTYYNLVDDIDLGELVNKPNQEKKDEETIAIDVSGDFDKYLNLPDEKHAVHSQYLLRMAKNLYRNGWLSGNEKLYVKILRMISAYPTVIMAYIALPHLINKEESLFGITHQTLSLLRKYLNERISERFMVEFTEDEKTSLKIDKVLRAIVYATPYSESGFLYPSYTMDLPFMSMQRFIGIMAHYITLTSLRCCSNRSDAVITKPEMQLLDILFNTDEDTD